MRDQNRIGLLILAGAALCVLVGRDAATGDAPPPLQRFTFSEPQLGTQVRLAFYATNLEVANRAARTAFDRVRELDAMLSNYRSDGELLRLCRTFADAGERDQPDTVGTVEPVRVSPELWQVLRAADDWSRRTQGAFDVSVGPVVRLWKRAIRQKTLPDPERLQAARSLVDYHQIELHPSQRAVRLLRPGMRLDLGAIAKGFIADEVLRQLHELGVSRAMVDAGGDLAVGQSPPSAAGWQVAVSTGQPGDGPDPGTLNLFECGVATSGDAYQHVIVDGQRYSHIVDPRTGLGVRSGATVTVVARDAMSADALASAVCVLGTREGLRLIEATEEAEARIVVAAADPAAATETETETETGSRSAASVVYFSSGFHRLLSPETALEASRATD